MPFISLQIHLKTHRFDHSPPYILACQFPAPDKQKANEYLSSLDQ